MVVPIGCSYSSYVAFCQYLDGGFTSYALTTDYELLNRVVENLEKRKRKTRVGNVFTSETRCLPTRGSF